MKSQRFTILVGSCARGTAGPYSDIDIVRVGHQRDLTKTQIGFRANLSAPISYIDYDWQAFASLHQSGSLFVHHILTEGKLLAGSPAKWADLTRGFSVTKDLRAEVREQLELCKWIARPTVFSNATMPILSHLFRALKNAAIFSLAQRGLYVYDKTEALKSAFDFLNEADIDLLIAANCTYERGTLPFLSASRLENSNLLANLCSRVRTAVEEMLKKW